MKDKKIVYVPTTDEVINPVIYRRQWIIYRNIIMNKTSRRKLLDDISIAFANCQNLMICYKGGELFEFFDIDEVFGDEPDMRWLSYYLEADGHKGAPKRISRKIVRLVILCLYIKVKYPRFTRYLEKH